jgi:hypothetical protein
MLPSRSSKTEYLSKLSMKYWTACTHLQFSHQGLQDTKEFAGIRMGDRLAIQSQFESIEQLVEGRRVDYRPWQDVDIPTMERGHKVCCTLILYYRLKLGLKPARRST